MALRTTSRSALLAGSLAFGLMFGGVALASEFYANGTGPGASAEQEQAQGTADQGTAAEADGSTVTVSNGSVTFEIPADWSHATYRDDGITYDIYTGDQAVFQVATITGKRVATVDDDLHSTAEFVEEVAGDLDVDEDALRAGTVQDRTVDGTAVRDIAYSERDDHRTTQGYATLVYGEGSVTVALSAYSADADASVAAACEAIHLSLTPVSSVEDGGFLADGTTAKGDVAVGDTLRYEDFEYTVSDDPSTYIEVDVNGTTLIGVPVTVKNIDDEPDHPDVREITLTGPSGEAQVTDASVYPDDSVYSLGRIGVGEEAEAMLYFVYEGSGDYTVTFADPRDTYDKDTMTIVIEL